MNRAFVGLGSNLQNPALQLRSAYVALQALDGCELVLASPVYRSSPMGPADQPDYLNAVVALDTRLQALDLLSRLQAIEAAQGRVRGTHWGPRTLDLDLLLCGDLELDVPGLRLPHPGLHERDFVLYPLSDIDAGLMVPGRGVVRDLLGGVGSEGLCKLHDFCWSGKR